MSEESLDPKVIAESMRGIEQRVKDDPEFRVAVEQAINELFGASPENMTPQQLMDSAAQVQRMLARMVDAFMFGRTTEEPSDEAILETSKLLDAIREEMRS